MGKKKTMGNRKGIHLSKTKEWTDKELLLLDDTAYTDEDIAKLTKRTLTSVQLKRRRRRAEGRKPEKLVETTVEQDIETKNNEYWKRQYDTLSRKYEKLAEHQSVTEQLVADIKELAPVSYAA